ncbi:proline iminopeptidase [Sparassis latifolia]|uniref:Proline iminopeptidase n=1 Tax=Sparassis crispa TaxID=139825 RepID=A0A401H4H0_9APHY|nr:proline iminopeptidase [Sparassis crispa]GBE89279.1 proline iminopeptidase [Sparassis crispa]
MATTTAPMTEGVIPFTYEGEEYHTYYKVFGDLTPPTKTPLVVLHGGPGLSHDYLLPISDLASESIPVIFYDQIGNSRSSHLRNKPSSFWTIDLFIDELVNLLNRFSIRDSFSLLGHSWGGILAAEYAVRRQPPGLRRLILADSLPSSSLWNKSTAQLIYTMPKEVQEGMACGLKNPRRFKAALAQFHAQYCCTTKPFPKELAHSFDLVFGPHGDPTVAHAPLLKKWSIIDRLHLLRMPTLVINGRKDIAQDFVVEPFFDNIPKVKWVTFENSSHTPFWEERERFMQLVERFLTPESYAERNIM